MDLWFVVHLQLDVGRLVLQLTHVQVAKMLLAFLRHTFVRLIRPETECVPRFFIMQVLLLFETLQVFNDIFALL